MEARGKACDYLKMHLFETITHHRRGDAIKGIQLAHMYTEMLEAIQINKCAQVHLCGPY